jgi:hypothetical protein
MTGRSAPAPGATSTSAPAVCGRTTLDERGRASADPRAGRPGAGPAGRHAQAERLLEQVDARLAIGLPDPCHVLAEVQTN